MGCLFQCCTSPESHTCLHHPSPLAPMQPRWPSSSCSITGLSQPHDFALAASWGQCTPLGFSPGDSVVSLTYQLRRHLLREVSPDCPRYNISPYTLCPTSCFEVFLAPSAVRDALAHLLDSVFTARLFHQTVNILRAEVLSGLFTVGSPVFSTVLSTQQGLNE